MQVKESIFGGWREVNEEQARRCVKNILQTSTTNRDAVIEYINNERLRGITAQELLKKEKPLEKPIDKLQERKMHAPILARRKPADPNEIEIKDCTVELERLAREQALWRFEQQVLFSLTVWQNDLKIRNTLPSVVDWVRACGETILSLAGG